MYGWIARIMVKRALAAMNAGDIGPLLKTYADDARVVFPGDHSWGATYQGRDEIERFLRRVVKAGVKFEPEDIVVKGPPWNLTLCCRFRDYVRGEDGSLVYENRVFEFIRIVGGKTRLQEMYLDTQRVEGLDRHLGIREASPA